MIVQATSTASMMLTGDYQTRTLFLSGVRLWVKSLKPWQSDGHRNIAHP